MKVTQVEIENVIGLLAATPRLIASMSREVEISHLKTLKELAIKDWSRSATIIAQTKKREETVYNYACRIAEPENKHCDQIKDVLKLASAPNSKFSSKRAN